MTELNAILKKHFGYDEFRPNQKEAILNVLDKKDTFVLMPTGGGKSLCYQLPSVVQDGLTLVVSPLIALMKDQVDSLVQNGVSAAYINSTLGKEEISTIMTDARSGMLDILYVAPERLSLGSFQEFLHSLSIGLIAIDEAHCISEWGHDFRPDYRNLRQLKSQFLGVPIIALTATATEKVRKDIVTQLSLENSELYVSSFNRENLTLNVYPKKGAYDTITQLIDKYEGESVIIYCSSRKNTEKIAVDLVEDGYSALPYHAGLSPMVRKQNQEAFVTDRVNIIVATIAFGMGIDKPDVRLVVHHTFPKSLEGYYQEIGRAGRDSLPAECAMLYSYGDKSKHEFFFRDIRDEKELANARLKLQQMIDYASLRTCRRCHILKYFGEVYESDNCGGCDVCINPSELFDSTVIVQKILSASIRTENRFGKNYLIDVLKGKETDQVLRNGHQNLSVFGMVSDYTREQLRDIISLLIPMGYLISSMSEYPTLSITNKAAMWLNTKDATLELPKIEGVEVSTRKKQVGELEYDEGLFERLRKLRKKIAQNKGVPPFVIFGDVSLYEMARYMPQSDDDFIKVSGVGSQKLERYGDIFMKSIKEYQNENETDPAPLLRSAPVRQRVCKSSIIADARYIKTKKLIEQEKSLEDMALEHGVKEGTIISHIEKLVASGQDIDIRYLTPDQKTFDQVSKAFDKHGDEMFSSIFVYLGMKYSYDIIKLVRLLRSIDNE